MYIIERAEPEPEPETLGVSRGNMTLNQVM